MKKVFLFSFLIVVAFFSYQDVAFADDIDEAIERLASSIVQIVNNMTIGNDARSYIIEMRDTGAKESVMVKTDYMIVHYSNNPYNPHLAMTMMIEKDTYNLWGVNVYAKMPHHTSQVKRDVLYLIEKHLNASKTVSIAKGEGVRYTILECVSKVWKC